MTFAISKTLNVCLSSRLSQTSKENFKKSGRITLLTDLTLITSAALIAGLILGGILTVKIPMGIGTIGNSLSWGLVGLSSGVLLLDSAVLIGLWLKKEPNKRHTQNEILQVSETPDPPKQSKKTIIKQIREEILEVSETFTPSLKKIKESDQQPSHPILRGLHLGSGLEFASTTNFACHVTNTETYREERIVTTNPKGFKAILTICPLSHLSPVSTDLADYTHEQYEKSFTDRGLTWLYA